jgi:hypothetical protein
MRLSGRLTAPVLTEVADQTAWVKRKRGFADKIEALRGKWFSLHVPVVGGRRL